MSPQYFIPDKKVVTLSDGRSSFPEPIKRKISQDEAIILSEKAYSDLTEHLKTFPKIDDPRHGAYTWGKKRDAFGLMLERLSMPVISEVHEKWLNLSNSLREKIKISGKEKLHNKEAYRIVSNLAAIQSASLIITNAIRELLQMRHQSLPVIFNFVRSKEAEFSRFDLDAIETSTVESEMFRHLSNPEPLVLGSLKEVFDSDQQGRFDRLLSQVEILRNEEGKK